MSPVIRAPYPAVASGPGSGSGQWTNFSEQTVDAAPSGWTPVWVTSNGVWRVRADANSLSGKVLKPEFTANGRRGITWDKAGSVQYGEILVLAKQTGVRSDDGTKTNCRVLLGAYGSAGAENGHFSQLGASALQGYYQAGTSNTLTTSGQGSFANIGDRIWLRLRRVEGGINDKLIRLKVWAYGSAEPGSPTLSIANTPAYTGGLGVGMFNMLGDPQFEYFSYSLDSNPAPMPA